MQLPVFICIFCAYFVKLQNGSELDMDIEVFTPASVDSRWVEFYISDIFTTAYVANISRHFMCLYFLCIIYVVLSYDQLRAASLIGRNAATWRWALSTDRCFTVTQQTVKRSWHHNHWHNNMSHNCCLTCYYVNDCDITIVWHWEAVSRVRVCRAPLTERRL